MVKGSVTISIEDYHELMDAAIILKKREEVLRMTAQELQVFLSFLCTRINIKDHVDEFNRQSKTTIIDIENGRAKIKLKDEIKE